MVGQLIGQKVGRYRIDSLIGEGGMGSVLRGFDEMLQRDVAIKILAPQFVRRPNFRERFLQEARTAARLRHPDAATFADALARLVPVSEQHTTNDLFPAPAGTPPSSHIMTYVRDMNSEVLGCEKSSCSDLITPLTS